MVSTYTVKCIIFNELTNTADMLLDYIAFFSFFLIKFFINFFSIRQHTTWSIPLNVYAE